MPAVQTTPKNFKPFRFHGVQLQWRDEHSQAIGDCVFCKREGKFYVSPEDGRWDCKRCNASGNIATFLRNLWEKSKQYTTADDYEALAQRRGLLDPETLVRWGAVRSLITGDWLLPGYGPGGKIDQLYAYRKDYKTGKQVLLATPAYTGHHGQDVGHALHGVNLFKESAEYIYLCEGPWDAMALWETLRRMKVSADGESYLMTANEDISVLTNINVLAVPGCMVFFPHWAPLFAGRNLYLLYDNDHPKKNPQTKELEDPAGYLGMKKVIQVLSRAEEKPASCHYLRWGEKGYDPDRPSGYDLRDVLSSPEVPTRIKAITEVLEKVQPTPNEWVVGRSATAPKGQPSLELTHCEKWDDLVTSWRKSGMRWTEGLDRGLSVMLASIVSTKLVGDQLWVKIVGPPACGKSVLCEAVSANEKYVFAKSSIRGFHSGYKTDREGEEDNGLVPKLRDKTLVTKDGDTLLQAPNLPQILSEARDLYDRNSRTHYRNKMGRDYHGVRFTWLLCGTESLRSLDSSELGERFLDCVIVEDMDEELERDIGWKVALRACREMNMLSNGDLTSQEMPEMVRAKQMTGGYINYLRENDVDLMAQVQEPEAALRRCQYLAEFVSFMRARPSKKQEEKVQREMSFRLISQHVRLAKCLAVVLNRKTLDDEVMRRVSRVALDTARGRTFEIVRHLAKAGEQGAETKVIALWTGETEEKERNLLRFLKKIKAVEHFQHKSKPGLSPRPRWRLTKRMAELYREVTDDA